MTVISVSVEYGFVCVAKLNIPLFLHGYNVIQWWGWDGIFNFEVLR